MENVYPSGHPAMEPVLTTTLSVEIDAYLITITTDTTISVMEHAKANGNPAMTPAQMIEFTVIQDV